MTGLNLLKFPSKGTSHKSVAIKLDPDKLALIKIQRMSISRLKS